ncbi:NOL3 isoform 13, partial [Pongo abelii]
SWNPSLKKQNQSRNWSQNRTQSPSRTSRKGTSPKVFLKAGALTGRAPPMLDRTWDAAGAESDATKARSSPVLLEVNKLRRVGRDLGSLHDSGCLPRN